MDTQTKQTTATAVRPFRVDMPDEAITDLRRRIAATRFPRKELVADASQGVQLAMLQELARYWSTDYDFRRLELRLNALPQFMTKIDGLDIHFIHVKSPHENALPLIITHGWPGSVIEMLEVIGPLTDPTAHGGSAEDAFDLVLPSLPGYGFSGEPMEGGWGPDRIARAWAELMNRLGYTRYVAQGGDQGANVTDAMGRLAPKGLVGVHLNLLGSFPPAVLAGIFGGSIPAPEGLLKRLAVAAVAATANKEPVAFNQTAAVFKRGYFVEMGEHPQTVGYSLMDSPVGLAAWMLDHDPDSYQKISHAFVDRRAGGRLDPRQDPRQHDAVLADQHRNVGSAALLGGNPKHRCCTCVRPEAAEAFAAGWIHRLPKRDHSGTAQLGREGLPQPHLLPRGRQGRALRRLGRAGALRRRAA